MPLVYERYDKKDSEIVIVPKNYTAISERAFARHSEIKEIVLPESIEIIGNYAFAECTSLKKINLPKNLKKIGRCAFFACEKLESLKIPKNISEVKENAFAACFGLKKITLYDNNRIIDKQMFVPETETKSITVIGKNTRVEFRYYGQNYTQFLNFVLDFVNADENGKYSIIEKMYFSVHKISFIIFYALNYENAKSVSYLKRNIHDAVKYLIDTDDIENLSAILKYIKKDNIDIFISYAIENRKYEAQVILTSYKNEHFGFNGTLNISILE